MRSAFRQLTTLPIRPVHPQLAGPVSAGWFPIVGLVVGAVWVASALTFLFAAQFAIAAAFVLLADGVVTGGRFLGAAATMVERMTVTASAGVVAVVLITLLRFSLLVSAADFPAETLLGNLALQLLVVPVAGATGMVALLSLLPVDADDPLARAVVPPTRGVLAVVVLGTVVLAVFVAGLRGLGGSIAALAVAGIYGALWQRRHHHLDRPAVFTCGLLAETAMLLAVTLR